MKVENIHDDETRFTVANLAAQTEKGAVTWECEEYLPAGFLLGDKWDDEKDRISHMGTFVYQASSRRYVLEIFACIDIDKSCYGSLDPKLSIYDRVDTLLSIAEADIHEENPEDEYGFIPLCDAIFKRSGEWLEADFFGRYGEELPFYKQKGITKKHREQPLCRLMERLMNERRVEDFHRMILDRPYREQLLNEL